jgi:hypothetical protein
MADAAYDAVSSANPQGLIAAALIAAQASRAGRGGQPKRPDRRAAAASSGVRSSSGAGPRALDDVFTDIGVPLMRRNPSVPSPSPTR